MKTFTKIVAAISILSCILMVTFGLIARQDLANRLDYVALNEEYEADAITKIVVNAQNRSVIIKESPNDKIALNFYVSNIDTYTLDTSGSILSLDVKTNWIQNLLYSTTIFNMSLNPGLTKIEILVPQVSVPTLSLKTVNGEISVSNLQATTLNADTKNGAVILKDSTVESGNLTSANGAVILNNVVSDHLILKTSNGEVRADAVNSAIIDARTANGQVRLEDITSTNLSATSSNGNIVLTVRGIFTDFRTSVSTNNGNIKINDEKYGNGTYHQDKMLFINALTSNGNIRLNFI